MLFFEKSGAGQRKKEPESSNRGAGRIYSRHLEIQCFFAVNAV